MSIRPLIAVFLFVACGALGCRGGESSTLSPARPNIIIFMADDMGFSDIGCYGSEIPTPNIDKLAGGGLRYTAFQNTSRCCPSRASLLTGLYAHRAGLGGMTDKDQGMPGYRGQIADNAVTIAESLHLAGYATWMVGKWHVTLSKSISGGPNGSWPLQRGFERAFYTMEGAKDYFKPKMLFDGTNAISEFPDDYYNERGLSAKAAQYIQQHDGKQPFFLYFAFYAPHFPLQAPEETIAKYRGKYHAGWDKLREERFARQIKLGVVPDNAKLSKRTNNIPSWDSLAPEKRAEMERRMEIYAAQVDELDQAVGHVVAALKAKGQLDNTLIFFLSDNGGCGEGGVFGSGKAETLNKPEVVRSSYGQAWANLSNTPYRRYKSEEHLGGVMSPLIVHWPAGLKEQGMRHQPCHIIDLLPTCLEIAGTTQPAELNGKATIPLQGQSLISTFASDKVVPRDLFWEHQGNRGVRSGDWKLVALGRKGDWELYNLKTDPTEMRDLSSERTDKLAALEALWTKWAEANNVRPHF